MECDDAGCLCRDQIRGLGARLRHETAAALKADTDWATDLAKSCIKGEASRMASAAKNGKAQLEVNFTNSTLCQENSRKAFHAALEKYSTEMGIKATYDHDGQTITFNWAW